MMTEADARRVPDFCWDRRLTAGQIRDQLQQCTGPAWTKLAAWIMREAAFPEVWLFLTPQQVRDHLEELDPFLGRRREFWRFIIQEWHDLGKL
jgi:hypothetical protein